MINEAVKMVLDSKEVNTTGYPHSSGLEVTRTAIAERFSTEICKLTPEVCILYPKLSYFEEEE